MPDVIYRINDRDEICYVNLAYDKFANDNGANQVISSQVLHRPLWDFVTDPTTQALYQEALKRVRAGRQVRFVFRCDSPGCRRQMEIELTKHENAEVQFRVRTLVEEQRPIQPLLDCNRTHLKQMLKACGWCKKINVENTWLEVEEAVARLGLFELSELPGLTHGICESCYREVLESIKN